MRRTLNRIAFLLALTGLLAVSAHAVPILIDFDPSAQTVEFGDQVSVDVVADPGGQLDPFTLDLLVIATYDLDINWDDTLLSLADVIFGGSLGDAAFFETFQDVFDLGPGSLNVAELSFLFDFTGLQDGTAFTLFTLVFDTTGVGTSDLDISRTIVGDFFGAPLETNTGLGSIEITDRIVAVPEPGTLSLILLGLAVLAWRRKTFVGALNMGLIAKDADFRQIWVPYQYNE